MMYELALHFGDEEPVILKSISERQKISEKYLSKLVLPLKAAGLVHSSRGSHGGYTLAREPARINLREIVELLEGDLAPVECTRDTSCCDRLLDCPTRNIWVQLDRTITGFLEGITLEDLILNHTAQSAGNYSI